MPPRALTSASAGLSWVGKNVRFRQHSTLTACWLWTGYTDSGGRPRAFIDGIEKTARQAVFRVVRGKEPAGVLKVECGHRLCVNPNHMNEATA